MIVDPSALTLLQQNTPIAAPIKTPNQATLSGGLASPAVTPNFLKKTKCISYVRQDQVYTHMIDVMSEISITSIKTYKS
jgi:hypothetical protein